MSENVRSLSLHKNNMQRERPLKLKVYCPFQFQGGTYGIRTKSEKYPLSNHRPYVK